MGLFTSGMSERGPDDVSRVSTARTMTPQNQAWATNLGNQLTSYGQGYQGQRVAGMDPRTAWGLGQQYNLAQAGSPLNAATTQAALRGLDFRNPYAQFAGAGGNQAFGAGSRALQNFAGGGDYAVNPHLAGATEAALDPIARAYKYGTNPMLASQAAAQGRFHGGGAATFGEGGTFDQAQENYARQLQLTGLGLANQSAEAERNRQLSAAGTVGQLGMTGLGYGMQGVGDAARIQQGAVGQAPGARQFDYFDPGQAVAAGDRYQQQAQNELNAQYQAFQDPFKFAQSAFGTMSPYFMGTQNNLVTTRDETYQPTDKALMMGAGIGALKGGLSGFMMGGLPGAALGAVGGGFQGYQGASGGGAADADSLAKQIAQQQAYQTSQQQQPSPEYPGGYAPSYPGGGYGYAF